MKNIFIIFITLLIQFSAFSAEKLDLNLECKNFNGDRVFSSGFQIRSDVVDPGVEESVFIENREEMGSVTLTSVHDLVATVRFMGTDAYENYGLPVIRDKDIRDNPDFQDVHPLHVNLWGVADADADYWGRATLVIDSFLERVPVFVKVNGKIAEKTVFKARIALSEGSQSVFHATYLEEDDGFQSRTSLLCRIGH